MINSPEGVSDIAFLFWFSIYVWDRLVETNFGITRDHIVGYIIEEPFGIYMETLTEHIVNIRGVVALFSKWTRGTKSEQMKVGPRQNFSHVLFTY